jgi:WD40 repeat protein
MTAVVVATAHACVRGSRRIPRSQTRWKRRILSCRAGKSDEFSAAVGVSEKIELRLVARVQNAHGGAVLALASVGNPDPNDSVFPNFVTSSIDGTVATWHVEEEVGDESKSSKHAFVRDAQFGDDDAPWWCLEVDDDWLYYGTHTRKVRARIAVDADLEKLPGSIKNHTGWVRAMARVGKTANEILVNDTSVGDAWRFSAACGVVRVWQDSFEFDEDAEGEVDDEEDDDTDSALVDVASVKIFTGDILCLAGFEVKDDSFDEPPKRYLFAGVTDGTVRGWHVEENVAGKEHTAPVMRAISQAASGREESYSVDLSGGRVTALHYAGDVTHDSLRDSHNNAVKHKVVVGCRDGTVGLVDARDLSVSGRVLAHAGNGTDAAGVAALCAGPNGAICSVGVDGQVKLWRTEQGEHESDDLRLVRCGGVSQSEETVSGRSACAVSRNGDVVGVLVGDESGGVSLYCAADTAQ